MVEFRQVKMDCYAMGADIAAYIAEGCGVDLERETVDRYRLAFEFIALMDDTCDRGTPDERDEAMRYWAHYYAGEEHVVPGEVMPVLDEKATGLRERISDPQALRFYQFGRRAVDLSVACIDETSAFRYGRLSTEEAKVTADMLDAVVTPQDKTQPGYERYAALMRKIASAGNVTDTIYDLRKDYRNGETSVKPTILNMGIIACAAMPDIAGALSGMGWRTIGMARRLADASSYSVGTSRQMRSNG